MGIFFKNDALACILLTGNSIILKNLLKVSLFFMFLVFIIYTNISIIEKIVYYSRQNSSLFLRAKRQFTKHMMHT